MQVDLHQYSTWPDVSPPILDTGESYPAEMVTAPASRTSSASDNNNNNNLLWSEQAFLPMMSNEAGMFDDGSDVSSIGSMSRNSIFGDCFLGFEEPNELVNKASNELSNDQLGEGGDATNDLNREVNIKMEDPSGKLLHKRTRKLTQSQKKAHNQVEKRYRAGINDKIMSLKNLLPSGFDDSSRMNKSRILDMVHDYLVMLKKSQEDLYNENLVLKLQIL